MQVEQTMSTLENILTAAETGTQSWEDVPGEVLLAINCTTNRVTKASPLEMLLGKVARPLVLLPPSGIENDVDLSNVRAQAEKKRYTRFVEKCVTGRRKRFRPHKVYIFLITITKQVER